MQFRYIRAWGRMMGSQQYYVEDQVAQATKDRAPNRAVYFDPDARKWVTIDEVASPTTRDIIERLVREMFATY